MRYRIDGWPLVKYVEYGELVHNKNTGLYGKLRIRNGKSVYIIENKKRHNKIPRKNGKIKKQIGMGDDIGANLYPTIKKINENLYSGKIPNTNLTVVMERIDKDNYKQWYKYIQIQSNPRVIEYVSNFNQLAGTTGDGTLHFKLVLEEVNYTNNELWIAYITKSKLIESIPDMYFYSAGNMDEEPFTNNIEMIMTVVSNPNALITSHMGIAMTAETVKFGRTKGTSVDLHSFAAKVMLMRNPNRKYMVNTPANVMRNIIINSLPLSATYVGTREMLQTLRERQNISFDEFITNYQKLQPIYKIYGDDNLDDQYENFLKPYYHNDKTESFLQFLEKHPSILSISVDQNKNKSFILYDSVDSNEPWLVFDKTKKDYQWMFTEPYRPAGITHYFVVDLKVLADSKIIV